MRCYFGFLIASLLVFVTMSQALAEPFPTCRDYDLAAAMFDQATYFFDHELYLAAATHFDKLSRRYPRHDLAVEARCQKGVSLVHLHRYLEADEVFAALWDERPWLEHTSIMNDLYLYWIKAKISLSQLDEAQQLFSAFKMSKPSQSALSETTFDIAEHFYLTGMKDLAQVYLMSSPIQGIMQMYADYLLGILALEDGQDGQAATYFQRVIDQPTNLRFDLDEMAMLKDKARYKLALLNFHHQRFRQAIAYYADLKNDELLGADRALGLAWCHFQLDEYDDVKQQLSILFDDYPTYRALSEATFLAGVTAMHTQEYDAAIVYFEQFVAIFEGYANEETIDRRVNELQAEQIKLIEMRNNLTNLEDKLTNLEDDDVPRFIELITDKKDELRHDLALLQKMLDTLAKRRSELPLLVEAEYGMAKARLKLSLATPK